MLQFGIVGYPKTGKTTLFNMMTGASAPTDKFTHAQKKNVGVAPVPDPRLDFLETLLHSKKKTYATIEYIDVPGIEKGRAAGAFDLNELKAMDGILHVVRAYEDPEIPHLLGTIDPRRDVESMEMEVQFADLAFLENRIPKAKGEYMRSKAKPLEREIAICEKGKAALESGRPLRSAGYTREDTASLRGFELLSLKPMLHVVNLGEDNARHASEVVSFYGLGDLVHVEGTGAVGICAPLEAEIAQLDPEDAALFRADAGIREPGLVRIVQASYRLLDVITFFTGNEKEVHAWTVRRGAKAPEAAGKVHTDMERGFIRAEVVAAEDLRQVGSVPAAREHGKAFVEGREYEVKDGDVIQFRFNV